MRNDSMISPTARVSTTSGCFRSEFPLLCQPGCTQLPFALHLWQFFSLVKVSIKRDSLGEYFQHHTHTIHGTGIFPYMCHKHQPNVGKYTSPTYFPTWKYFVQVNLCLLKDHITKPKLHALVISGESLQMFLYNCIKFDPSKYGELSLTFLLMHFCIFCDMTLLCN